jgi:hypothetical protein
LLVGLEHVDDLLEGLEYALSWSMYLNKICHPERSVLCGVKDLFFRRTEILHRCKEHRGSE